MNDDTIQTASFDQFTDFKNVDDVANTKSKIVFTKPAFNHFLDLIKNSNFGKEETGCYFLGKELGKNSNQILIDRYTPSFQVFDTVNYKKGGLSDTIEAKKYRKAAIENFNYDCLFHFHVHIAPEKSYFDVFSDQDLNLYRHNATEPAWQYYTNDEIRKIAGNNNITDDKCSKIKESFVGKNYYPEARQEFQSKLPQNRKVSHFGILATPNRAKENEESCNYQISGLYCEPYIDNTGHINSTFYRFPSICCMDVNNNIYQIGTFKRCVLPNLTTGRIVNSNGVYIQAIGNDPNTGLRIENSLVGKYLDGEFIFNDENNLRH